MSDLREAAKLALIVLENGTSPNLWLSTKENLRKALAESEQKPLVWMNKYGHVASFQNEEYKDPLYTAPPKREWVGLTDAEVEAWRGNYDFFNSALVREVEAKLKEKNT